MNYTRGQFTELSTTVKNVDMLGLVLLAHEEAALYQPGINVNNVRARKLPDIKEPR